MLNETMKRKPAEGDEFTNNDIAFINKDFNSPSMHEQLKRQFELFRRGIRPLDEDHSSNFEIGIEHDEKYCNAKLDESKNEETRAIIKKRISEIEEIKRDLRAIQSGTFDFLEYRQVSEGTTQSSADREVPIEKVIRTAQGIKHYSDYLDRQKTSRIADNLSKYLEFISIESPGAKIDRIPLFSFSKFYRLDGDVRVAKELEKLRRLMLERSKQIHALHDRRILDEIKKIKEKSNRKESEENLGITELEECLRLPGDLEIRTSTVEEVSARLKARNVIPWDKLNQPPEGGLFRMTLNDSTIQGSWDGHKLNVRLEEFNPGHLLTYAMNVNIKNPEIEMQSREWWEFTVGAMGVNGARTFYEMLGYLLITTYPLPTERSILTLIGDPGSGKGTHLAAVELMLTVGSQSLFARAGPHKLADSREHFSKQNLQNKLGLVWGDLAHTRIHDFALVNDLFGGEPAEMEKKFHDPTVERPIFKAFWGSAPPLFRITQAGGAWRRMLLIVLNSASTADESLKPRMLKMIDGFFLNGLIGLAYLVANNWRFTSQKSNDELEKLWEFHADSVRVWAESIVPEPSSENNENMQIVDDLYEDYAAWAKRKQIEPVKQQTFSVWLRNHEFVIAQRTIDEGRFKGKRKKVTFATMPEEEENDEQRSSRAAPEMTWETYISRAPLMLNELHDLFGQFLPCEMENNTDKNNTDHVCSLPQQVVQDSVTSEKAVNSTSQNDLPPCTTSKQEQIMRLNQTQRIQKTILEIASKISQGKPEIKIKPSTILENWPTKSKDLIVSLEDLNERVLPSMAADGLITLHNGTISVTGKKLEQINYVLVTVLEDLSNGVSWINKDYYLHKGDMAHVPEELAWTLVQQHKAVIVDNPDHKEGDQP
jgi:phage/plasmid-associated DNA primase